MAQYRTLEIPDMCVRMNRLQGENLNDPEDDTGADEIFGLVTVVERDARGRLVDTHVGGSSNYITVTKADRGKWKHLPPSGHWLKVDVPHDAQLQVNWFVLEDDSIFDDAVAEAIEDLASEIGGEFADLPGVARATRLFKTMQKFVARVTGEQVLGQLQQIYNLPREPQPLQFAQQFPCISNNADYDGYARLTLSKVFKS